MRRIIKKKSMNAKVAVITIIFIAIGSASFIFWRDQINDTPNMQKENLSAIEPSQPEEVIVDEVDTRRTLVLNDWGVEFVIPEGLDGVVYYKNTEYGMDSYDFTTTRIEALGDSCSGKNGPMAFISRTTFKSEKPRTIPANNNEPIDNYYYYPFLTLATCSDERYDIQQFDSDLLFKMLSEPISTR